MTKRFFAVALASAVGLASANAVLAAGAWSETSPEALPRGAPMPAAELRAPALGEGRSGNLNDSRGRAPQLYLPPDIETKELLTRQRTA